MSEEYFVSERESIVVPIELLAEVLSERLRRLALWRSEGAGDVLPNDVGRQDQIGDWETGPHSCQTLNRKEVLVWVLS